MPVDKLENCFCCPITGCSWAIQHCKKDEAKFIAHLVNMHKLPILQYSDGSFVKDVSQKALVWLAPYVTKRNKSKLDLKQADSIQRNNKVFVNIAAKFKSKGRPTKAEGRTKMSKKEGKAEGGSYYARRVAKMTAGERQAFYDCVAERRHNYYQKKKQAQNDGKEASGSKEGGTGAKQKISRMQGSRKRSKGQCYEPLRRGSGGGTGHRGAPQPNWAIGCMTAAQPHRS